MLPKKARLTARQFEEVMKKGKVSHSPLFIVRYMPISIAPEIGSIASLTPSQIAAVGPVKIAKTAVERNSIRRRTYSAVEPIFPEIKPGFEIIIIAKEGVKKTGAPGLTADIRAIFAKAGLLK